MPDQVRLQLSRLQTSPPTTRLFPWYQHLCGDTVTIKGWERVRPSEREPGREKKRGREEVRRRQIKEGKTGRGKETAVAVVAAPDKAELFMRPRFCPHYDTKSEIVLPRQSHSQPVTLTKTNHQSLIQQHLQYIHWSVLQGKSSNTACWRNALQCDTLYLSNKPQEDVVWKDFYWGEN